MADTQGRTDRMVASVAHVFSGSRTGPWERHHLDAGGRRLHVREPPGDATPRAGRRAPAQRRAAGQGLVRVQDERGGATHGGGRRRSARRTGIAFRPEDVAMTAGAFGALGVTIRALCDVGDEVIFLSPPWFFYELMIASPGATAVRVRLAEPDFDLDPDAVAAAITPRTRAIIVNTPNNPRAGSTASPSWRALGEVLRAASARHGRPIVLLSDESYNRIVFDGIEFRSPALDYDASIDDLHVRQDPAGAGAADRLRGAAPDVPGPGGAVGYRIFVQQLAAGWGFPNALLQHAIARPRGAVGRHPRAPGASRPDGAGAARAGLRGDDVPRGRSTSWRARPTPTTWRSPSAWPSSGRSSCRARSSSTPGWFRVLADGQRRDGRARTRGLPRRDGYARRVISRSYSGK